MDQRPRITVWIRDLWIKYRWPILAGMGFLSALVELGKLASKPAVLEDTMRILELILQGIILPLLLLTLQKTEVQKNFAINLLSLHDALVLQLNRTKDWDELLEIIGRFSQKIIPLSGICLLMRAPGSNNFDFEFVRVFDSSLQMVGNPNVLKLSDTECCLEKPDHDAGIRACSCPLKLQIQENYAVHHRYCLPLPANDAVLGVLHLYLPVSYKLSRDQKAFFGSIVPEIVMSITNANLKLVVERREAAFETERLRLASDLHDTLGQDLAYLRNKIDQQIQNLAQGEGISKEELDQMFIVAEEANQTVRNILAVTRSNQGSSLGDRLLAYSKAIGERAKLDITLESYGNVRVLNSHMQFQLFLIFREVLANIEKHAYARHVTITLNWSDLELAISINDDGRGFLTDQLDQRDHFGLTIIETRTREMNGLLSIISVPDQGTMVSIRIPISKEY